MKRVANDSSDVVTIPSSDGSSPSVVMDAHFNVGGTARPLKRRISDAVWPQLQVDLDLAPRRSVVTAQRRGLHAAGNLCARRVTDPAIVDASSGQCGLATAGVAVALSGVGPDRNRRARHGATSVAGA